MQFVLPMQDAPDEVLTEHEAGHLYGGIGGAELYAVERQRDVGRRGIGRLHFGEVGLLADGLDVES